MNPWQSQPPALEPVSLAEAKTYLRVDHGDEDSLISSMITAARRFAEDYTRSALIAQQWSLALDKAPAGRFITLPRGPVMSVVSIVTVDDNDISTPFDLGQVVLSLRDGKVHLKDTASWPTSTRVTDGITITWQAGYGASASDVPAPIRQAILQLVAQMYQDRSVLPAGAVATHPTVSLLLSPYRQARI